MREGAVVVMEIHSGRILCLSISPQLAATYCVRTDFLVFILQPAITCGFFLFACYIHRL